MKFATSLPIGEFLDKLELPTELRGNVARMISEYWSKGDPVAFKIDIDENEAFAAVEDAGMLPETDLDDLTETDDLIDGVKAVLDGDLTLALALLGRVLDSAPQAKVRLEQLIYAHRRKAAAGSPSTSALAA
jgi:hypothetical protein